MSTTKSPGEKLQQIYMLAKEAGIKPHGGLTLQELQDKKQNVVARLERLKPAIYDDLNADKIPSIKIEDFDDATWFRQAQEGKASFQSLFEAFRDELATDGLAISFGEAHDGGGMKSWLQVKIEPHIKNAFDRPHG